MAVVILPMMLAASAFHLRPVRAASGSDNFSPVSASATPTWSHDIAPILYSNCTTCHHTGGAGPFSLLTYAAARRWGAQAVTVTQSRYMPPWLPEPGYGDFADVRRLPDADLALLRKWFRAGMPQGDLATAPQAPKYDSVWQMGKPDLILKQAQPFTLAAGGTDVFRNFVFTYPLKQSHFIRAMEIRPGAPQVVHHANVLIDRTASFRLQHPTDWQTGVPGMEILLDAGNTFDPDSHFLFWKPDTPALVEPDGMPWRLDPGNDLILNIHLKPSGKSEIIDSEIGLYFTDKPPTKQPMLLQLDRDDGLDIPAGDKAFVVEDSMTLPIDVEALGVYPHAHYLGKDMQAWAVLPNGEKKWLVWIRDWDIDRQAVYRYREPVQLPKGSVLHMRYVYDNSAANARNPHDPPIRVRAGNRSEDEMAHLWLQVLPTHADPKGPDPRLLLEEAWMRHRLTRTPNDRISLYNLGAALAGEGKYAEAASEYGEILKISPHDSATLIALGAALDGSGDWQKARRVYTQVVESAKASQICDARFDLATLDLRHEQLNSAEGEFRTQLASCAEDAETHAGLAATLMEEGQSDRAKAEFNRSLELNSENFQALLGLSGIELDAGDNSPAIEHLASAARIRPSSEEAHTQLARAYAQSGNLDGAQTELRRAAQLQPGNPTVHSALAQVLAQASKLEDAIAEQRLALKLLDDDADGWNNLGVLEARTGKLESARADFERALKLQPEHAAARANLARLPAAR
ncbi:MAG TPA: tetratricopeptide repeat protein [Acidobacteriaceae bacterium]|nr:tetratricopeptide repeat protein [Acidobacteriaceae bacterium]